MLVVSNTRTNIGQGSLDDTEPATFFSLHSADWTLLTFKCPLTTYPLPAPLTQLCVGLLVIDVDRMESGVASVLMACHQSRSTVCTWLAQSGCSFSCYWRAYYTSYWRLPPSILQPRYRPRPTNEWQQRVNHLDGDCALSRDHVIVDIRFQS